MTDRRGDQLANSQVRPESVGIAPVRLPSAEDEHNAPIDLDAEADLFIDWRKELSDASPNEGNLLDHAYLKAPEGKSPRDMAIDEVKIITRSSAKPKSKR